MLNTTALRVARARVGISQKELAEKVGITQSHYCRLEHGKQNGSIKTLQAICGALGVRLDEVLG